MYGRTSPGNSQVSQDVGGHSETQSYRVFLRSSFKQGYLYPPRCLSGVESSLCLEDRRAVREWKESLCLANGDSATFRALGITGLMDQPLLAISHCGKLVLHIRIQRDLWIHELRAKTKVEIERPTFSVLKIFYPIDDGLCPIEVKWHAQSHRVSHKTWATTLSYWWFLFSCFRLPPWIVWGLK